MLITQKLSQYQYAFKVGGIAPGQGMFGTRKDYGKQVYILDSESAGIEFGSTGEASILVRYDGREKVKQESGFEKMTERFVCVGEWDAGFSKRKRETKRSYSDAIEAVATLLIDDQKFMRDFTNFLIPAFVEQGVEIQGTHQKNEWAAENATQLETIANSQYGYQPANERFKTLYQDTILKVLARLEKMSPQERKKAVEY